MIVVNWSVCLIFYNNNMMFLDIINYYIYLGENINPIPLSPNLHTSYFGIDVFFTSNEFK